jgi:hypothetical protein
MTFYAQLLNKVFFYTQVGYDGQTYRSEKKPGINLYSAVTEFILLKNKIHLGFGLHSWNGLSRYANSNPAKLLVIDKPGFADPVYNTFSQFGRQFGMYAKGNLNQFHYRISVSKPFEYGVLGGVVGKTIERVNENLSVKSYFAWQFFDTDDSLLPYMAMNNLGQGKIFNLGAGFYYHPQSTTGIWDNQTETSDIFLFGLDGFWDLPLKNKGAITSYFLYNYNFFGRNYLHSGSLMNVSRMDEEFTIEQGAGNSQWDVGTGHIVRIELGYLLAGQIIKSKLQPYGAVTYKNFEALDEASFQFDIGINLLTYWQHTKWTLQYSTRPIYGFVGNRNIVTHAKGQISFQTQIWF